VILERLGRWRRVAGYAGFGLVVYLIALYLAFPYDRVKDLVVAMAAMNGLDLDVGEAGPGLGMGVALGDITVKTRPADGSKPTQLQVPQAYIAFSPLASLMGEEAYDISADALGGEIEAETRMSPKRGSLALSLRDLQMRAIPGIKEAINLPLSGALDGTLSIEKPNHRLAESSGELTWKCEGCAVGDGKEKLKIASNPLLAEGITFPRIRLGDFAGKVVIEKGTGKLQGVSARSPDGEIHVEGEVRLADPVGYSYLNLYVRFKWSDALLKSNDKLQLVMQLAESMGKRPDGYYGFRVTGPLSRPAPIQWAKTSPFSGALGGARSATGRPGFGRATTGDDPLDRPPPNSDRP
jgi:type II secretion system protein N